jgi:hypothetical protein
MAPPSNVPPFFEARNDHARYVPVGQVSLSEAVVLIGTAIRFAAKQNIGRLLVNITGLAGLGDLDTFDRYFSNEQFAKDSKRRLKIAMVARPELIDRNKFGVTVGRNRGMCSNIFSEEDEAIEWLLGGAPD